MATSSLIIMWLKRLMNSGCPGRWPGTARTWRADPETDLAVLRLMRPACRHHLCPGRSLKVGLGIGSGHPLG